MIDTAIFLDLLEGLQRQGILGDDAPHPYSGRAMYGKQCVAISSDSVSEWSLAVALANECRYRNDVEMSDIPEPHTDSMGRGIVMYWPRFEWPADRPDPHNYADDDEDAPA